jgi:hypothetical protein
MKAACQWLSGSTGGSSWRLLCPWAIDVLGIVNPNQQQAGMVDSQGDDGFAGKLALSYYYRADLLSFCFGSVPGLESLESTIKW